MGEFSKTFRMTPEGAAQFGVLGRIAAWITWCSAAFLFGSFLWGERSDPRDAADLAFVFLIFLIIFVPFGAFFLFQRWFFKHWVSLWASLEVDLGDDFILRRQRDQPEIRIRREEITHLYDLGEGGLIIRGGSRHKQAVIPKSIEGYEELRSRLFQWRHPEPATQQRLFWILLLGGALAFALADLAPAWTNNPHLVGLAHAVAGISFLFAFIESQRSRGVDTYSKRLSWIFLLLAALEAWATYNKMVGR